MRKKLEKLRYSFELERKENNKNLVELYSSIIAKKLDPILQENNVETKNLKNNIAKELINVTFSQSNTQPFTEIMDSSSSEEIIQKKFDHSSLKDILSISFEIKSSYKNINKLSKGEIIRSSKYRKTLENLIKNNKIFKDTEFKTIVSKYTAKFKKHKNKYGNFTRSSTDKNRKINKNNKISLIQKSKFKYSSNNLNNYFNDKKIKKIKNSFFFGIFHSPTFADVGHNFHNILCVVKVHKSCVALYCLFHVLNLIEQCVLCLTGRDCFGMSVSRVCNFCLHTSGIFKDFNIALVKRDCTTLWLFCVK